MIEISNFLYNLVRGLASHLLSDPETRRNLFPPLPPLNNVFFISFFFLVAFLFIVQYFVRQFSHCAINSFCPNCCAVLVTRVIHYLWRKAKNFSLDVFTAMENNTQPPIWRFNKWKNEETFFKGIIDVLFASKLAMMRTIVSKQRDADTVMESITNRFAQE